MTTLVLLGVLLLCSVGTSTHGCGRNEKTCRQTENTDIWRPAQSNTFQWQISSGTTDLSIKVDVYDVDLFDVEDDKIEAIHKLGSKIICYFSAGSYESWRPDKDRFLASDMGKKMDGWDELWLDIRSGNVPNIMLDRLKKAKERKCDGVEPDNVDGFANDNGLNLTANDQLDYNKFIASSAHQLGLSVGLKNDVEQIADLEPFFDWALNESCMKWRECFEYEPFMDSKKAVFHVEYVDNQDEGPAKQKTVCSSKDRPSAFVTLIKTWYLDAWRLSW